MIEAIARFNSHVGSNPGRSGHSMSVEAGRILFEARDSLSRLFSIDDPMSVVFTSGMTHSLNLVIKGLLRDGGHVITTSMEHNSVMRPLRFLEETGLELSVVQCDDSGVSDPELIRKAVKGNTRLIIMNHGSNVSGTIAPVAETGRVAREEGVLFCVDSAQTAGCVPIDVNEMNIDLLCFSGHKGLLGPTGTGGLYIKKGLEKSLVPLMHGGTGSRSEYELQPDFMPDMFESGTLNILGIAGLLASVEFILSTGVENIRESEILLADALLNGLSGIPGVRVYGPLDLTRRTSVISFNIEGMYPSDVSLMLDEEHGILTRPGLHCAPSAHKTIGSFPAGTTRFSPGFFTTMGEIEEAIRAVHAIAVKNS